MKRRIHTEPEIGFQNNNYSPIKNTHKNSNILATPLSKGPTLSLARQQES